MIEQSSLFSESSARAISRGRDTVYMKNKFQHFPQTDLP